MQVETHTTKQSVPAVRSGVRLEAYWKFFLRRFVIMNIGLLILAAGIDVIVRAKLGASPWDVLHLGLTYHLPISFGVAQELAGAVILIFSCWMAKSWPTVGCVINIIMVGIYSDALMSITPVPDAYWLRFIQFFIGLGFCGLGAGVYISSRLGAGPRDWLMLSIHQKTGIQIRWVRTMLEVTAVLFGILLGGPFSIGTILFSLLVGFPTEWGIKWAERTFRPFVERREAVHETVN